MKQFLLFSLLVAVSLKETGTEFLVVVPCLLLDPFQNVVNMYSFIRIKDV